MTWPVVAGSPIVPSAHRQRRGQGRLPVSATSITDFRPAALEAELADCCTADVRWPTNDITDDLRDYQAVSRPSRTSATGCHCQLCPTWACATRLTDLIVISVGGTRSPSASMTGAAGPVPLL
jgi:hypothetical protein